MKDTVITVLVLVGIFIILPVLILWLRDKVSHRTPTPEQIKEFGRRFRARLINPDFSAVEAHYGHTLPKLLKDLYANNDEILRSDFELVLTNQNTDIPPWYICFYQPLDAEQLQTIWPGREKFLEIADDGSGNAYMVDPTQEDPPVLFHDHETGEVEEVTKTLSEFMKCPRESAKD